MTTKKSDFWRYLLIFFSLFLALCPVILSSNYLRQDDLMWEIWPGMKMSDFGYLYYNTVYQLVRPICMLSFYITDLISINIHHSVYVRFLSLIVIGIMGILLYRWQLYFNSNRMLALTFAIASFTLPGFQLFAATGNYFLILFAMLLTFAGMYCWHHEFHMQPSRKKNLYYILGCVLFFASLLEYPLSSMYGWALLSICYLNKTDRKFFYQVCFRIIYLMILYFLLIKLTHWVFQVDLSYGRPAVIDTTNLLSRVSEIFGILAGHANFWMYDGNLSLFQPMILSILALASLALAKLSFKNIKSSIYNIITTLSVIFLLSFLAYSPIFASPERQLTIRYTLVTMPILLYLALWSCNEIICSLSPKFIKLGKLFINLAFISLTSFGVCYANIMVADGIVGPHQHDFDYVQQQLNEKVIPLLKENKKVVIHAIDCDSGKTYSIAPNVPQNLEYSMRTCQYQQQVIGVIFHSMMSMGHLPNYHAHNTTIYKDNEIIVKDTPWGDLIVNSKNEKPTTTKELVTIDMRDNPIYQRFEFYKNLIKTMRF